MRNKSRFANIANYIFMSIFLLSAAVQYNDQDPLLWILVYGGAAIICLLWNLDRLHWAVPAVAGLAVFIWSASLFPGFWGLVTFSDLFASVGMKSQLVEEAREAVGLLIIFFWMLVLSILSFRMSRSPKIKS